MRISASYKTVNLERSLVDVAVRYCKDEEAPEGAIRLFGEELFPICSPALQSGRRASPARRCTTSSTTRCCTWTRPADHMDWDTWLAAQGHPGLKPAASIAFDSYEQMIQAALSGQGVAMGIGRLVSGLIDAGRLVAPFCKTRDRLALLFHHPLGQHARRARTCRRSSTG